MIAGNAARDTKHTRGWLIGHFMPEGSPLQTKDLELKWAELPAGTTKAGAGVNRLGKTITMLVSGEFAITIDGRETVFTTPGDYTYHAPGEAHSWRAITDCVVLSIRWPSVPDDQNVMPAG